MKRIQMIDKGLIFRYGQLYYRNADVWIDWYRIVFDTHKDAAKFHESITDLDIIRRRDGKYCITLGLEVRLKRGKKAFHDRPAERPTYHLHCETDGKNQEAEVTKLIAWAKNTRPENIEITTIPGIEYDKDANFIKIPDNWLY